MKAVQVANAGGGSPFVLACDHASNRIPEEYGDLGLTPMQRLSHIAWDPGALAVAHLLSEHLDAPLVYSTVCRLVIDCNRAPEAVDLIPTISERTEIPGNAKISAEERARRISTFHAPFHAALDALLDQRAADERETILVTIHSFTPVYKDVHRPWPIGLIHGADARFTAAFRDALVQGEPSLIVGWNEPYSALNGVTHTLEHHGDERGLASSMIEIRNDEIAESRGVIGWAAKIAVGLTAARASLRSTTAPATRARA